MTCYISSCLVLFLNWMIWLNYDAFWLFLEFTLAGNPYLKTLPEDLFNMTKNLEQLKLERNCKKNDCMEMSLPAKILHPLTNLKSLLLEKNSIRQIHSGFLKRYKKGNKKNRIANTTAYNTMQSHKSIILSPFYWYSQLQTAKAPTYHRSHS